MSSSTKTEDDAKKFLFEHDFDKKKEVPEEERLVYTQLQMDTALAAHLEKGKAEGQALALQSQEEKIIQILTALSDKLETLAAMEDRREIETMRHATQITMQIVRKILPQFAEKTAIHEIEGVILENIDTRKDEPRIAVTVPTVHLEYLKERVDALALEKGYAGKIILIADDNMTINDCRVEWADGGAERLFERLSMQIENELTKAMGAMDIALHEQEDIKKQEIKTETE